MKINQVEELTGIPKKNIRFYEDQKLLSPGRNPANGYREYSMEDVAVLEKIRLFRKLGIPIEAIRQMQAGDLSLEDCLYRRLHGLREERQSLQQTEAVCRRVLEESPAYDSIDTAFFLGEIETLEKGGAQFMDIEKKDRQQSILVPVIAAALTILFAAGFMLLILYLNTLDPAPKGVVIFVGLVLLAVCVGVIFACIERIREIKGGEWDEARHY